MSSDQGEIVEEMVVVGVDYDDELQSEAGSCTDRQRNDSGSAAGEKDAAREVDEPRRVATSSRRNSIDDRDGGSSDINVLGGRFEISDGEGDEEYRRKELSARVLFVHGIPPRMDEKRLHAIFSAHGTVKALHIPLRPYDRIPKPFGFVRMSTPEEATTAMGAESGKTHDGVVMEVVRAKRSPDDQRNQQRYDRGRGGYSRGGGFDSSRRPDDRFNRGPVRDAPRRREYSPGPPVAAYNGASRYNVRNDYSSPPPAAAQYTRPAPYPLANTRDYPEARYDSRRGDPYDARRADPYGPPPSSSYDYPPPVPPTSGPRGYPPGPPAPRGAGPRDFPVGGGGYYDFEQRRPGPPPSGRPYPPQDRPYADRGYPPHNNPPPPGPSYYPAPYRNGPPPPPMSQRRYDGPPPRPNAHQPIYDDRFEGRRPNGPPSNGRFMPSSGGGSRPRSPPPPSPPRY